MITPLTRRPNDEPGFLQDALAALTPITTTLGLTIHEARFTGPDYNRRILIELDNDTTNYEFLSDSLATETLDLTIACDGLLIGDWNGPGNTKSPKYIRTSINRLHKLIEQVENHRAAALAS